MQKLHTPVHPVELALMATIVVIEAAAVLVAALLALVCTLARWRPAAPAPTATPPAPLPPLHHPHAALAQAVTDRLTSRTVAQLRAMARSAGLPRTLARTARKAELVAALLPLEVALA